MTSKVIDGPYRPSEQNSDKNTNPDTYYTTQQGIVTTIIIEDQ